MTGRQKIFSRYDLRIYLQWTKRWKRPPVIVFTNGCFDILHEGHLRFLQEAATAGDMLVVAVNNDASVYANKGEGRPFNVLEMRMNMLAAWPFVDFVAGFSETTPAKIISLLRPDVLVKGPDWPVEKIVGAKMVKGWGGQVKTIDVGINSSTTGIIEKAKKI